MGREFTSTSLQLVHSFDQLVRADELRGRAPSPGICPSES
jgi:hypothetical protein